MNAQDAGLGGKKTTTTTTTNTSTFVNPTNQTGDTGLTKKAFKLNADTTAETEEDTQQYYSSGSGSSSSSSSSSSGGGYTAATLPSATSQADYIETLYANKLAADKAALEASYNQNVLSLDNQESKIPTTYNTALNDAAADYALQQKNYNEYAATAGINTGAGSQARLAQSNAYQKNVGSIQQAKADALAEVAETRAAYEKEYQDAIQTAIAENDAEKAEALYEEAKRVDESIVATAVNQATENYRAWSSNH